MLVVNAIEIRNATNIWLHAALRLYPPVPVNTRTASKMTTLPVGGGPDRTSPVLVQKGENVAYCIYAMQRRQDLYGEDSHSFRPERWDEKDLPLHSVDGNASWGYLPFNGGPRICLGRKTALLISCKASADQTSRGVRLDASVIHHCTYFANFSHYRNWILLPSTSPRMAWLVITSEWCYKEDCERPAKDDASDVQCGWLPHSISTLTIRLTLYCRECWRPEKKKLLCGMGSS